MARRFESRAKAPELEYRSPPPRYKHQQLELELECARVFNSVQTCQPEYGMYYYTFVEFSSSQPEYDDRRSQWLRSFPHQLLRLRQHPVGYRP